jgi:cytochrome c peroxidase
MRFADFLRIYMPVFILLTLLFSLQVFADNTLGLPELSIPANNPQSQQKIALGQALFFDSRFSKDNSISCASCHQPHKAYTDGVAHAIGINGQTGSRNSPTLLNVAFLQTFFVDGRENSLEQQALKPILNRREHGLENAQQILDVIEHDDNYKKQLQQVFAITEQDIRVEHIAQAIASFERTLIAGNSPFDQYYFAGDRSKLSASAARGLRVFRRKGNCANCHEISWNNALFTDHRFYNIGIGFKRLADVIDRIEKGGNTDQHALSSDQQAELGRFNVSRGIADIGKFKTPTLRNIALTAPYMHDGSLETLEQVVDYYNKGGDHNRFIDAAIFPLQLSSQEKTDLVAFMQSLTSPQRSVIPEAVQN